MDRKEAKAIAKQGLLLFWFAICASVVACVILRGIFSCVRF